MTFVVAPGSNSPTFILHDDAITHVVMSHVIAVFRRGDDGGRSLDAEPELVGLLQNPAAEIRFTRTTREAGHHFAEAFRIGMWHIVEGADHLLFLFTLLVPAPFLAAAGRWSVARSRWNTIRHLAAVVTAFTIGHSITLMGGVLFDWQLPWPLVEVVIALSVFVAAVQAWRPIFGSREPLLALVFGLVHGMAFSAVIGRQLIDPLLKFEAVLAFNLGVETVQLGLVAISAPLLLFLASRDWYHRVRSLAALASGLVAAIWVVQRLVGMNVVAAPAGMTGLVGYLVVPAAAAGALMLAMRLGRGEGGLEAKHAASGRQ